MSFISRRKSPAVSHIKPSEVELMMFKQLVNEEGIEKEQDVLDFEEAVTEVGIGSYHYGLWAICAFANGSDAIEIMAISFVLTKADELFHNDTEKGLATSIVFAGMLIGGLFWGTLGDKWGRCYCLKICMGINSLFSIASCFCPNITTFLIVRFGTGIGIGGSIPLVFTYFSEFFAKEDRGRWVVYLAFSWIFGSTYTCIVAWVVLGVLEWHWRIFLLICCLPVVSGWLLLWSCDDSPKFLILTDQPIQAFNIINSISLKNRKAPLSRSNLILSHDAYNSGKMGDSSIYETFWLIFSKEYYMRAILAMVTWFTLSFSFYGIAEWLPSWADKQGIDEGEMYVMSVISRLSEIPLSIVSVFSVEYYDRNKTLIFCMGASSIVTFFMPLVSETWQVTLFSCAFFGLGTGGWNALDVVSTELFPTHLRSTSFGLFSIAGRLGSIAGNWTFSAFISESPALPITIASITIFVGCIACSFLPNMKGKAVH